MQHLERSTHSMCRVEAVLKRAARDVRWGFSSLQPERACRLSGYLDVAERHMSGGKEEEEGIPDNKAVLRDALSSLDIRGRKAPATDEVCRKVFRPTALPSPTPAWCCAGPCDARLLGHAARSGHVGIDARPRRL